MNFARQPWLIPLLLVLVILLFGANKLPGLARNMGESMRIFKSEVSEMRKDDEKNDTPAEAPRHVESSRAQEGERSFDARTEPLEDPKNPEEIYRRD